MDLKLSNINPYMRDPVSRKHGVLRSVATSSAIEGIHAPFAHVVATPRPSKTVASATKARRSVKR